MSTAIQAAEQDQWLGRGWHPRLFAWASVGVATVAAIVLRELGLLLAEIPSNGGQAYSASVFTGPSLTPWTGAVELRSALDVWLSGPDSPAPTWIGVHLLVDLILFIPGYCSVLYQLMGLVGLPRTWAKASTWAIWLIDTVETLLTAAVLKWNEVLPLWLVPAAYTVLWIAVLIALVAIVVAWASPTRRGVASAQRAQRAAALQQDGLPPGPAVSIRSMIVLTGIFLAVVALPGGGALEQLPDVLRAQLDDLPVLLGSTVALGGFVAAIVVAGWRAVPPLDAPRGPAPTTRRLLVSGWLVGAVMALGLSALAHSPNWPVAFAFPLVITALVAADLIRAWASDDTRTAGPLLRVLDAVWSLPGRNRAVAFAQIRLALRDALHARRLRAALARAGDWLCMTPGPVGQPTALPADSRDPSGYEEKAAQWIGGVAGAVVVGSGLGLIRAAARPALLGVGHGWVWMASLAAGFLVAVLGGWFTQLVIVKATWLRRPEDGRRQWAFTVVVVMLVGAGAAAAVRPELAAGVGTTGAIVLGLALLALLAGELHHRARIRQPWQVTRNLGIGTRSPWLGMTITAWMLAGLLNTHGGYHDVQIQAGASGPTYASLQQAYQAWATAAVASGCMDGQGRLPLVIAAAPGGGIRASYWTASVLDQLVPNDRCGRARIFAVSGVSGGSVGTAAWMLSPPGQAKETVTSMARDHALSASAAALFLRDLPQPFVGLGSTTRWADRAAVMEDVWAQDAPVFQEADGARLPWPPTRGQVGDWQPALVFNASSVTDGCRALVTNVAGLPASTPDCGSALPHGSAGPGPLPGTLDATNGLNADLGDNGDDCAVPTSAQTGRIAAITGALLSARFPIVSPSGVLERCLARATAPSNGVVTTDYAVDGGYFDNTGLLSALSMWHEIERLSSTCTPPSPCPQVQPWIVMLDNHYRSTAAVPPASRATELTIPLQGLQSAGDAHGDEQLEQVARVAMAALPGGSGHFVRIGPTDGPGVTAPLGWVLSAQTRENLDGQLWNALCNSNDTSPGRLDAAAVTELLGSPPTLCDRPEPQP